MANISPGVAYSVSLIYRIFIAPWRAIVQGVLSRREASTRIPMTRDVTMDAPPEASAPKQFTVVMRGSAAAIFWQGESLCIDRFVTPVGPVTINYTTRWLNRGEGVYIPGHLWIEIVGTGENLESALAPYANAGIAFLPVLSLVSNAAIGEPDVEIGFESTPASNRRSYFQSYLTPESGVIHAARQVNRQAVIDTLEACHASPEQERLLRAANQYRLALNSWRLGRESLVLRAPMDGS